MQGADILLRGRMETVIVLLDSCLLSVQKCAILSVYTGEPSSACMCINLPSSQMSPFSVLSVYKSSSYIFAWVPSSVHSSLYSQVCPSPFSHVCHSFGWDQAEQFRGRWSLRGTVSLDSLKVDRCIPFCVFILPLSFLQFTSTSFAECALTHLPYAKCLSLSFTAKNIITAQDMDVNSFLQR